MIIALKSLGIKGMIGIFQSEFHLDWNFNHDRRRFHQDFLWSANIWYDHGWYNDRTAYAIQSLCDET